MIKIAFLALLLGLATTACARQDHQRIGDLVVSVPWARATPPHAPVAAGFLTVQNRGTSPDRLLAVETAAAQRVEIHEVREQDGIARMRQLVEGLPLPAGATVLLAPGGYHLMFIQPAQPFVAGEQVAATLVFEHAGRLDVYFQVRGLAGTADHDATTHH